MVVPDLQDALDAAVERSDCGAEFERGAGADDGVGVLRGGSLAECGIVLHEKNAAQNIHAAGVGAGSLENKALAAEFDELPGTEAVVQVAGQEKLTWIGIRNHGTIDFNTNARGALQINIAGDRVDAIQTQQ